MMLGIFYKAVVQAVILFVSKTWVMNPYIIRIIRGYHHQVVHWITSKKAQRDMDINWSYPPMAVLMTDVRIEELETYVSRHQRTLTQYISTIPIMYLSLEAECCSRGKFYKRWWEQWTMDLTGARKVAVRAVQAEEEEDGSDTRRRIGH